MFVPDETMPRMLLQERGPAVAPAATARVTGSTRPSTGGVQVPSVAAGGAPPAALPALHFAAALLFLGAGAAGLVMHAPGLAATNFLAPGVGALTHLFTLGWITTSIMGALYQFLPVALDQPVRSIRVAYATLLVYVPGLAAFTYGLGSVTPLVMLVGASVMSVGVLLFVGNMAATLQRARRRDVTWWALACATFFLAVTLLLGLALTGNLRWGYLGGGRLASIGVHLHVALAGWVLLVMVGVAHRLLPMFLLSHGVSDRFGRAAVALIAAGAGMLALLHHAPPLVSHWIPSLLIGLGTAAFLVQARAWFVTRRRRQLDSGMRLTAAALALLGLTLVMGGAVMMNAAPLRFGVAYVVAALLAISLFVVAHYYRIVPFLVWYHRFGPLAGTRPLPKVSDLYSARAAGAAGAALVAGAVMLISAVALGAALPARIGATLFACGVSIVSVQMLLLWRTRP